MVVLLTYTCVQSFQDAVSDTANSAAGGTKSTYQSIIDRLTSVSPAAGLLPRYLHVPHQCMGSRRACACDTRCHAGPHRGCVTCT